MYSRPAYAKINLGLEVLRKRGDGFHDINTVFARISLHDDLFIEKHETLRVECKPDLGISAEENLVYKAADLLRRECNVRYGAKIIIHKHIPNGAGLGGGSSDAATVLLSLNSLWSLNCSEQTLRKLAIRLGSDVPYFIGQGFALASGRGEELQYFEASLRFYVLLVFPSLHFSTAQAYSALRVHEEGRSPRPLRDIVLMTQYEEQSLRNHCVNDFESVAFREYPLLKTIKEHLYELGASYSQMSGSGSCMYGLFSKEEDALRAATAFSEYRTFVCRLNNEPS